MLTFALVLFSGVRDFTVALMVGTADTTVISVIIWNKIQSGRFDEASAISVMMPGFVLVLAVLPRGAVTRRIREGR